MRQLTNDLDISIELRRGSDDRLFVVMVVMVNGVVIVLRLSFHVEHLRRFRRLDFDSNLAVGVARRAAIPRRILRA